MEAKLEALDVPACAHSIQLFQSFVGPTKFENIFFKRAKLRFCPYAHISNNIFLMEYWKTFPNSWMIAPYPLSSFFS